MIKAIVTGSRGFIGKKIKVALLEKGFDVLGVSDEYLKANDWEKEITIILNSFKPDVIFHAGACSDTLEQNVNFMMLRNYESTKIFTNWSTVSEIPFIYSSSAANYGTNNRYPANLYGWSKYVSEDYVVSNHGVALRYFNVYGPGESDKGRMASFLYQAYLKNSQSEDIYIFPKTPKRDFVYVDDVVNANIYAYLNFAHLNHKVYEVSTGISNSFETLLDLFGLNYLYAKVTEIPDGYQFYTCGDPSKWMPGWKPKFDLVSGTQTYKNVLDKIAE